MKDHLNEHATAYPSEVFDPDAVRILTAAFDDAWRRLQNSGIRFESAHQSERARTTLAKFIIEQGRQGERDNRRLRDGALLQYARSNLRDAQSNLKHPPDK
jgi:hypothetical protein